MASLSVNSALMNNLFSELYFGMIYFHGIKGNIIRGEREVEKY